MVKRCREFMKMSSLIDETVEKLKIERIYVCYQKLYKPIYEHLISEQCKSRIEILQVDDMEYTCLLYTSDAADE